MSSTPSAPTWQRIQIPRPLQRLFDRFPLLTYDPNELPERSQHLTSSELPTLYVFSTDEDARLGLPSFNPGCLKWQTLLRLAKVQFRILPSTNHASPTGSLPFLLPPRTSPTSPPFPIPSDKLASYARQHGNPPSDSDSEPPSPLRAQAYLSLVTLHLRNAWLHALYLDRSHARLLHRLYLAPASSSRCVQAALRYQLRRAAAEQILLASNNNSLSTRSPAGVLIDEQDAVVVYAATRDALSALATLLSESATGWFFGAEAPTAFDASVFSYTHLMMEFMDGECGDGDGQQRAEEEKGEERRVTLGEMVRSAGAGELARHRQRMLEAAWPGWDGKTRG
ncbi:hypothetical protein VTK56DRAFT_324 [Thermocarpiscus australiensis]